MKQFICLLSFSLAYLNAMAQNVGVGTATPLEKLHVAGNIKGDTIKANALKLPAGAGAGKVLATDAAGNAFWQNSSVMAYGTVGFGTWGDPALNSSISEYNPVGDADGSPNDNAGYSVAISGNMAIVGADGDDCCGDFERGSVSFYRFDGSKWVFLQKLIDADGDADDHFGISVAISGNYAIVGAYGDDCCGGSNQGSVTIYQFNGSNWVVMQKITDPDGNNGDVFGCSVSISGNYALIGAFGDDGIAGVDQGSACVFQFNGSDWVFKQKLTDANGAAFDYFGTSVSISGTSLIVGAYGVDYGPNIPDQGAACIFQFNGGSWVLKFRATHVPNAGEGHFGYSVSISGNYAVIGGPNMLDLNSSGNGKCVVYHNNGANWDFVTFLDDNSLSSKDFGYSVVISGDYIVVGDKSYQTSSSSVTGAAYVYVRAGLGWQRLQLIKDPAGTHGDNFGYSTAIDGSNQRFLIGAYGFTQSSGKAVFGKVN